MSFNLNGMMQGIGAGLVNYGEILKEQDKQDWDEQQALLKYEREERMKKLELQASKENTQYQVDATKTTAANTLAAQEKQYGEANKIAWKQANDEGAYKKQLGDAATSNASTNATQAQQSAALNEANVKLLEAQAENTKATAAGTRQSTEQITKLDTAIQTYAETMFPGSPERQVIFAYQMKTGKTTEDKPLSPEIVTEAMKQAEELSSGIKVNSTEWKQVKNKLATEKGAEPSDIEVKNAIVTSLTSIKIKELEKDIKGGRGGMLQGSGATGSAAKTDPNAGKFEEGIDDQKMLAGFKTKDVVAISEMRDKVYASGDRKAIQALERNAKAVGWDLSKEPTPEEKKLTDKSVSQPAALNPDDTRSYTPRGAASAVAGQTPVKIPIGQDGKAASVSASSVLSVPTGASTPASSGTVGLPESELQTLATSKATQRVKDRNGSKPKAKWGAKDKELFDIYKAEELRKLTGGK